MARTDWRQSANVSSKSPGTPPFVTHPPAKRVETSPWKKPFYDDAVIIWLRAIGGGLLFITVVLYWVFWAQPLLLQG